MGAYDVCYFSASTRVSGLVADGLGLATVIGRGWLIVLLATVRRGV